MPTNAFAVALLRSSFFLGGGGRGRDTAHAETSTLAAAVRGWRGPGAGASRASDPGREDPRCVGGARAKQRQAGRPRRRTKPGAGKKERPAAARFLGVAGVSETRVSGARPSDRRHDEQRARAPIAAESGVCLPVALTAVMVSFELGRPLPPTVTSSRPRARRRRASGTEKVEGTGAAQRTGGTSPQGTASKWKPR